MNYTKIVECLAEATAYMPGDLSTGLDHVAQKLVFRMARGETVANRVQTHDELQLLLVAAVKLADDVQHAHTYSVDVLRELISEAYLAWRFNKSRTDAQRAAFLAPLAVLLFREPPESLEGIENRDAL